MARPKEFEREEVLGKAMEVFWSSGYEATSLQDLGAAMGIGRQSLYDTFRDKRTLYLEALRSYQERSGEAMARKLNEAVSPLAALRELLRGVVGEPLACKRRGCMMMNAAAELLPRDEEVARIVAASQRAMEEAFRCALERARRLGEIPPDAKPQALARYLAASFLGLRAVAKSNPDPSVLDDVVEQILKSLDR